MIVTHELEKINSVKLRLARDRKYFRSDKGRRKAPNWRPELSNARNNFAHDNNDGKIFDYVDYIKCRLYQIHVIW